MLRKFALMLFAVFFMYNCEGKDPFSFVQGLLFQKKQEKLRIGVSFPTKYETRWNKDLEYLIKAADEAGVDLYYDSVDKNAREQEAQCDALLQKKLNVLILAPHDARAAGTIVEKAKSAGVKVISYDRLVLGADVDFYISFDNVRVGELQAEYITRKVPTGNYIVLSGAPTDNNSKMFHSGAMNVLTPLADAGKIRIVADSPIDNWDAEVAENITNDILNKYGTEIGAVIAPNDRTAGGVINALKSHHLAGYVAVSGQDADFEAAGRVMSGLQSMTVFKDSRNLANAAVGAAINMALGQPPPSSGRFVYNGKGQIPSMLLEPITLDKDNIVQTLEQTGYISMEQARELLSTESIVFGNVDEAVMMPAPTGGH